MLIFFVEFIKKINIILFLLADIMYSKSIKNRLNRINKQIVEPCIVGTKLSLNVQVPQRFFLNESNSQLNTTAQFNENDQNPQIKINPFQII